MAAGALAFFAECFFAFFDEDLLDFIESLDDDGAVLADGVVDGVDGVVEVWALAPKATAEASTAAIRFLIMVGVFLQERG